MLSYKPLNICALRMQILKQFLHFYWNKSNEDIL